MHKKKTTRLEIIRMPHFIELRKLRYIYIMQMFFKRCFEEILMTLEMFTNVMQNDRLDSKIIHIVRLQI